MIKKFDSQTYTWRDTDLLVYKQDGSPFKDVTRQVLFDGAFDIPCQFRYFEVKPHGYSTLEYHEHTHMVMIFRGKGQCLLGHDIVDVAVGDMIEIPSGTVHQFRANQGDYLGFLCLVNLERDKVTVVADEKLEELQKDPAIRDFLQSS
ncbi:cupin [Veillonella montpellierensis DNF00314]|uniref:Cupin n=1 Tax=Veillonella montpellierensis DNF00314 TaxID=1401067 RepID=A0A096AJI2_9FIRM|nr:cupin domain-containing protein [Veillonella montpellierensis]KGF47253.1 cupin [Veillonella montpellierensis DNF00314]